MVQDRRSVESDPIDLVESATSTTQEALRAAQSALTAVQAAQEALNFREFSRIKFLGHVSHELRTPIASILGYTQILRDELEPALTRHHREFFQTILTNVRLSLGLLNDLSVFAQMDSEDVIVSTHAVGLLSLISHTVDQLHPFAEEKGILLSADLPMEEYHVAADEELLSQVLYNLVAYAIRYTDDGGVTIHVVPGDEARPSTCSVEIMDTGRGMRNDIIPTAWELSSREKRTAYLIDEGVSISLAISLEYLRAMNGSIDVKGTLGQGTTLLLTFDRARFDLLTAGEVDRNV